MNVSKIVSTVLNTVTKNRAIVAGGIGAIGLAFVTGVATGRYSKETETTQQQPTEQKAVTKPQVKKEAKSKEPIFEYVSPKIGEYGIVKADTAYFAGTKQKQAILYSADKNRPVQEDIFNKDGSLKSFTLFSPSPDKKNLDYDTYNNLGENTESKYYNIDGSSVRYEKDKDGRWSYCTYDKKERLVKIEDPEGKIYEYTYNADGSETTKHSQYGITKSFHEYDKDGKEVRKKDFDNNGVVKYTVNTKYDKDGCVVKKDTIWNK